MIDNDIVFDIGETARYLRVSEQTIYKLLRRGDIAAAKAGREWRIHKSAVIDFLRGGGEAKKRGQRQRKGEALMTKIIILFLAVNLLSLVAGHFIGEFCRVGNCGDTPDAEGENVPLGET